MNTFPPFSVRASAQALARALGSFVPSASASKLAKMRRSIGVAARAIEVRNVDLERPRCVMVTLTYAGSNADWRPEHISDFVRAAREWLRRRHVPMRYVWVAELQGRGVIHYHVALWLPEGVELPKPDEWFMRRLRGPAQPAAGECAWWPHGMSRIETARRAVPYLMKYLSKGNEACGAALPERARSHGRGGLGAQWRAVMRWLSYPAFVQARADVCDRWRRVTGGGWASPCGEWFASEWRRSFVGTDWALVRVADHGRPFEVAGPYVAWHGAARAAWEGAR